MPPVKRPPIINAIDKAVRKVGRTLVRDFGEVEQLQVSKKGTADFVSSADIKADETLRRELSALRPDYGFLTEELGANVGRDADKRWIVDPIDGTTNFLHGIPHFAISIGVEENGEIVAGAVYAPLSDELYWAAKGQGAYLNDRRMRVSARRQLVESVIATGIPFIDRGDHDQFLTTQKAVMAETAGVRRFGCASLDLAWVAAGRFDGFWEFGLSPWDIAAGVLLVREAGGYVSTIAGQRDSLPEGSILAANDYLHQPLGRVLRRALGIRPALGA